MGTMGESNLDTWLAFHHAPTSDGLHALLHDNAVFHSPVVHTPQEGRTLTHAYLSAAAAVLFPAEFRYLRQFDCGDSAVLEFQCSLDGTVVNGVDMIAWDDAGLITDFKVMVRPAKAIPAVQDKMAAWLATRPKAGDE